MSENTQNHKNPLYNVEETFCEKREKPQNFRIRLTLPQSLSRVFFRFWDPQKSKTKYVLDICNEKWRYRCLYPWAVRAELSYSQTDLTRLKPSHAE